MNINGQLSNSVSQVQTTGTDTEQLNRNTSKPFLSELSQNKLKEAMSEYVDIVKTKEVHEEQLQYILVNAILSSQSKKVGDEYTRTFAALSAQSRSTEDNVKMALRELVQKNLITVADAESINGITFKAAQLDGNLTALYDGTAGPNDPTKATSDTLAALEKANAMIQSIRDGKESFESRALDAPSNSVRQNISAVANSNVTTSLSTAPTQGNVTFSSGKDNGFLWKPQSDNNGRLVVLTPPSLAGNVISTEVHSKLPPNESTLIEKGTYSGNGNGGRDHFRFSKPGASYPDGVYVVARLRNGEYVSYNVPRTSTRQSK